MRIVAHSGPRTGCPHQELEAAQARRRGPVPARARRRRSTSCDCGRVRSFAAREVCPIISATRIQAAPSASSMHTPTSGHLPLVLEEADLLGESDVVALGPVLGDLPVLDPVDVDGLDLKPPAGGGVSPAGGGFASARPGGGFASARPGGGFATWVPITPAGGDFDRPRPASVPGLWCGCEWAGHGKRARSLGRQSPTPGDRRAPPAAVDHRRRDTASRWAPELPGARRWELRDQNPARLASFRAFGSLVRASQPTSDNPRAVAPSGFECCRPVAARRQLNSWSCVAGCSIS
jgi:hypothetical protein